MLPTFETVTYEVSQSICRVALNRPTRRNAWIPRLEIDLYDALQAAADDDDVRVIVVTGSGGHFCTGADPQLFSGDATQIVSRDARGDMFPLSIPKPIIAAINGDCSTIGLLIALTCDVRFAVDSAELSYGYLQFGLIAEHGLSWLLTRYLGVGRAVDLMLSSRGVTAGEARQMGLVNHVVAADEFEDAVVTYARSMASHPSLVAAALTKRQIYADLSGELDASIAAADRFAGQLAAERAAGDETHGPNSLRRQLEKIR